MEFLENEYDDQVDTDDLSRSLIQSKKKSLT